MWLCGASGMMTAWFLAPMLLCTRLLCELPRWWMYSPARFDPTKEMARISGWSQMKSTVGLAP